MAKEKVNSDQKDNEKTVSLVEKYKTDLRAELSEKIGIAQATVLLQPTPTKEIRKRLMNPKMPKSDRNPEFSYVEQAYVSELLDLALFMDWDLVVTKSERVGEEALVEGYLEARFKSGITVKKHGFGGATHRNNPNLTWGDTFKAAASDLMKNCAARMGIGRDLYRKDEERIEKLRDLTVTVVEDLDGPATDTQKSLLDTFGVKYKEEVTFGEARDFIRDATAKKPKNG